MPARETHPRRVTRALLRERFGSADQWWSAGDMVASLREVVPAEYAARRATGGRYAVRGAGSTEDRVTAGLRSILIPILGDMVYEGFAERRRDPDRGDVWRIRLPGEVADRKPEVHRTPRPVVTAAASPSVPARRGRRSHTKTPAGYYGVSSEELVVYITAHPDVTQKRLIARFGPRIDVAVARPLVEAQRTAKARQNGRPAARPPLTDDEVRSWMVRRMLYTLAGHKAIVAEEITRYRVAADPPPVDPPPVPGVTYDEETTGPGPTAGP